MCNMKMAVLGSVLASLLLLVALPVSAGMQGWQYQQEIAIQENSGETLHDYQVLVELDGGDFPEEAQPDGDDIRFTDADGHELSYWIEEFDAGSDYTRIWVKVPEIPANGEARIMMWYGNPDAESVSDGDAVFEFFDDFEGSRLDTGKWDMRNSEYITVAQSKVKIGGGGSSETDGVIWSKSTFPSEYIIRMNAELADKWPAIVWNIQKDGGGYAEWINPENDKGYFYYYDVLDGSYQKLDKTGQNTYIFNQFKIIEAEIAGNVHKFYQDGILKSHYTHSDYQSGGKMGLEQWSTGYSECDWLLVRQYTSSEPTVTLAPPTPAIHTALYITKSPSLHSIRQFGETAIILSIDNSGTIDATDIEITDTIHPSFDLTSGDFPNPKRYDLIRPGETRDLQYAISSKESGTFTLDPATVTYADEDGNIQEVKSKPASIKVIPSTESDTAGTSHNPSVSSASVQLHGEKTDVVLGEDILLKLSAVNLITKPTMHVQVIIIPPSGMSVTSSAFAKSGAGQYTTTYELEPGTGKDIEVAIRSNQVGDFDVKGRIIYYFGNDREDAEDHTLTLPITVQAKAEAGAGAEWTAGTSESEEKGTSTSGFVVVIAIIGLLLAYLRKRA
ncbi:MAG: DUF2341 domain-containing protein [Methanosarcinales archaeon]|nr:DUF2341 domain-containing protein [Methanosarcinales archaeon]